MDLYMSKPTNQIPTRYSNNQINLNYVINLMFLCPNSSELDNHIIHPEWKLSSDYASLTIDIVIIEEQIQTKKCIIIKNSKEENNFLAKLIESIKGLDTEYISSKKILEDIVQKFTGNIHKI